MAIIGISLFEKVKLLSLFVNELACLIHIQAKAGVDEPHHYVLSLTILLSPTPLYFPFTSLRQFLEMKIYQLPVWAWSCILSGYDILSRYPRTNSAFFMVQIIDDIIVENISF